MRTKVRLAGVLGILAMLSGVTVSAQTGGMANTGTAQRQIESRDELLSKLNGDQRAQFDNAAKAFGEQRYGDALKGFKALLEALPDDAVLSKFAGEAALDNGDNEYALKTMKPIATANPDDWQAAALLTRAYAQSGDAKGRDAGIAQMMELKQKGLIPERVRDYAVEQLKLGDRTFIIRTSVTPWGRFHVYAVGELMDASGKRIFRVALESDDIDQTMFAQKHPDEAAKGVRIFSLDGYQESAPNGQGQTTSTHSTYKFFQGQPTYAETREEFLKIVGGRTDAMSTTQAPAKQ
jgi:tetratricopeptide (TPR) repeat protein